MTGSELIQIVDGAVEEAVRRSGAFIACRPGCTPCCLGPFPISLADAARLREGLAALDRERAERVRSRAREQIARHGASFPGDPATGILDERREDDTEEFADDEPCPALDPATGLCDLYAARPLVCRTFGPALRFANGSVGACELCYDGAADEEIDACAVDLDIDQLEAPLLESHDRTVVAYALVS